MTTDAAVIIVGGGPAGLSTWLHLHALAPQLARDTLLLERATYPREKLCGGGITRSGDLLLRALGVDSDCPSRPIARIDIRGGEVQHSVRVAEPMRVVRRSQFDHALAQAALARGLTMACGETVTGVVARADAVEVRTNARTLRALVMVAADGAQSSVRRSLGLAEPGQLGRLLEVVTAPGDPMADPGDAAVFDFAPLRDGVQGYVWHFPCVIDGRAAVSRGIYDSRIHPERPRADLRRVFAAALDAVGIGSAPDAWESQPIRWFGPPGTITLPRIVLAGDAAGVDPLLGEGIAPSIAYGELAATLLAEAFARHDFSFADAADILRRHPLPRALVHRGAMANAIYARADLAPEHGAAMVSALFGADS
jgi:flavin-dependent dehydrogenase